MTNGKAVLVVDDEEDIRSGVTRWLHVLGYKTHEAMDGQAGADAADTHQPDAIVLDMMMPRLDGMQTLAHLKSSHRTSHIPVVMLSASLRDEQRALDAGARFFVQKPYDGKRLVDTIAAAIGER